MLTFLGSHFDVDPQYPWTQTILAKKQSPQQPTITATEKVGKQQQLEQLGVDFTVTISSDGKSISYTKDNVRKHFYLGHDKTVKTTHWQVDAGELCGKDLMKTKQEHLKALQ